MLLLFVLFFFPTLLFFSSFCLSNLEFCCGRAEKCALSSLYKLLQFPLRRLISALNKPLLLARMSITIIIRIPYSPHLLPMNRQKCPIEFCLTPYFFYFHFSMFGDRILAAFSHQWRHFKVENQHCIHFFLHAFTRTVYSLKL